MSVLVPYHLTISPASSRTGSKRARNQRNAPSWRRRHPSNSPLLPAATIRPPFPPTSEGFRGEPRGLSTLPPGLLCRHPSERGLDNQARPLAVGVRRTAIGGVLSSFRFSSERVGKRLVDPQGCK